VLMNLPCVLKDHESNELRSPIATGNFVALQSSCYASFSGFLGLIRPSVLNIPSAIL
jgi:hypothetical protein